MAKTARQTTFPGMEESQPAQKASNSSPGDSTGSVPGPVSSDNSPTTESEGGEPSIRDWTIYVVDSYSLIFQVFHAMSGSELTSPRGDLGR